MPLDELRPVNANAMKINGIKLDKTLNDESASEYVATRCSQLYFNEFDANAAQWIRNLYPKAKVDERSIKDVSANDVHGFRRCHFFGGIGGWEYALQLAGWPIDRPVWTGSCPCQPFSGSGKQQGAEDERHLWPEFCALIGQRKPAIIFGEQVASKLGREWLDGVSLDLEELGYAVAAADLCAASCGAPHIRQRLFWVAYANGVGIEEFKSAGDESLLRTEKVGRISNAEPNESRLRQQGIKKESRGWRSGFADNDSGRIPDTNGTQRNANERSSERQRIESGEGYCRMGDAKRERSQRQPGNVTNGDQSGWDEANPFGSASTAIIPCADGKSRRVPLPESGIQPLAYGVPVGMGRGRTKSERVGISSARANRITRLRGYGNAIVPQVAAEFIRATMETIADTY